MGTLLSSVEKSASTSQGTIVCFKNTIHVAGPNKKVLPIVSHFKSPPLQFCLIETVVIFCCINRVIITVRVYRENIRVTVVIPVVCRALHIVCYSCTIYLEN